MKQRLRPTQATVYAGLFALAGAIMLWLGSDAYAYWVTVPPLLLAAVLLWRGTRRRWLSLLLNLNQLTAIVLILDLWLGDWLHLPKLTISAAMLAANLVLGGPLMGVLAIGVLCTLHFGQSLRGWFQPPRQ